MIRRLFSWLNNHQVLAISALNAGLIIGLAVVIGLASTRNNSNSLVWALDTSENAQPRRKLHRAVPGKQPQQEAPAVPGSLPLAGKTPALKEPGKEPVLKQVEVIAPPATATVPPPPVRQETTTENPAAVEDPGEPAEADVKAPDLKPAEKPGFPVRSSPPRPNVRTLRARPVPPTQRGRILRPRQ